MQFHAIHTALRQAKGPLSTPPPTLAMLRQRLNIPPVNTGRRIELFGSQGIISDDREGLHAMLDQHGRTVLLSGVEFQFHMYRGQTQDFGKCTPSIARIPDPDKQFLALCRTIAFEDAIGTHPLVQLVEQTAFMDAPFFVDRAGLAQHYGHATDMLDITGSFDVASFFATCRWDVEKKAYEPYWHDTLPGVMYRIHSAFVGLDADSPELSIVGWQPLPRPEQQQAQALQLNHGVDFESLPFVEKFRFAHEASTSHQIYEAFDQGRALFPPDAAAELSALTENLLAFTDAQIERAWARLKDYWTDQQTPVSDRALSLERCGVELVEEPVLKWDGLLPSLTPAQWQEQWQEVLCRVRYRRAF
jgi:hypothetical protein